MKPIRVYVAGPYSQGDIAENVSNALAVGDQLLVRSFSPYVPHLTHFWHIHSQHPYALWMRLDAQWLAVCDAVYRITGPSQGADAEVAYAQAHGIPVFDSIEKLLQWRNERNEE